MSTLWELICSIYFAEKAFGSPFHFHQKMWYLGQIKDRIKDRPKRTIKGSRSGQMDMSLLSLG